MSEASPARDARAAAWSGAGGLAAALAAAGTWFCCLPIAVGAAGGAFAGVAGAAWGARPWLLGASVVLLAFGFWRAYRRTPCAEGEACATPAGRRRARVLLWLAAVIAILAFTFPQWSSWLIYGLL